MEQKNLDGKITRIESLAKKIRETTQLEKIKFALEKEYERGNFYSIPEGLIDLNNSSDVKLLEKLRKIYLNSENSYQVLPDGLFELSDVEQRNRFAKNLISKLKKGIIINFSFSPKNFQLTPEELEQIREEIFIRAFFLDDKFFDDKSKNYDKQSTINMLENRYNQAQKFMNQNDFILTSKDTKIKSDRVTKTNNRISNLSMQESLDEYYKIFEDRYRYDFFKIEVKHNKFVNATLRDYLYHMHELSTTDLIDLLKVDKKNEALSNIEQQRKILLDVIDNLDNTGCLQDLIDDENKRISSVNNFMTDETKIEEVSKKSIINYINELELSNPNEAVQLLVYSRSILNKLAHNYDDNMRTTLYLNSIDDTQRVKENNDKINKLYENINDILTSKLPIQEKRKAVREKFREYGINNVNNFVKSIVMQANNTKGTKDGAVQIRLKEFINNNLKLEDKTKCCVDIFEQFDNIQRCYSNAIQKSQANGLRPKSFSQFFEDILNTEEEGIDIDKHYDKVTKNIKEKNIAKELKTFIEKIRKDGIILNPEEVLKEIARNLDVRDQIYNIKHFITTQLICASKDDCFGIHMENLLPQSGEKGVLDIFVDGSIQIFGAHYSTTDFEATDEQIQSLPSVPEEINDCFDENKEDGLNFFIPMKKITAKQKEVFKQLFKTIECLENIGGKTLSEEEKLELFKYQELKELKNSDEIAYESIKTRILLGCGIEEYKKFYGVKEQHIELTAEDQACADFIMGLIRKNPDITIDEFEKGESLKVKDNILQYCKQELERIRKSKKQEENEGLDALSSSASLDGVNREGRKITQKTRDQKSNTQDSIDSLENHEDE